MRCLAVLNRGNHNMLNLMWLSDVNDLPVLILFTYSNKALYKTNAKCYVTLVGEVVSFEAAAGNVS